MKRSDVAFEIHVDHYTHDVIMGIPNKENVTLITREAKTDTVNNYKTKEFPICYMLNKHGRIFTSTIAYMMAQALEEDIDEIGLWGIDLVTTQEFIAQREAVDYFIGYARGKGIKTTISEGSDILWTPLLYGYEDLEIDQLSNRINNTEIMFSNQAAEARSKIVNQACMIKNLEIQMLNQMKVNGAPQPILDDFTSNLDKHWMYVFDGMIGMISKLETSQHLNSINQYLKCFEVGRKTEHSKSFF